MGLRGRQPSSKRKFRGRPVVLRGRVPAILAERNAPERAIADSAGYVSIHRLIASEARGKHWIKRNEAVRPIDGDPWNWDPKNLLIVQLADFLPKASKASAKPRTRKPHVYVELADPLAANVRFRLVDLDESLRAAAQAVLGQTSTWPVRRGLRLYKQLKRLGVPLRLDPKVRTCWRELKASRLRAKGTKS